MKDPNEIVIRPVVTEASLEAVDMENKLTFFVDLRSNKNMIRWAVETLYEVVVERVNTLITPTGEKKAFVKLAPEYSAGELATRLGIF
ncbi:MAG: 50S ribosomal protein L23 [Candidatus Thorarchaeota archaeon]|jgi:large subunit ribosomal protein L23|nr:50S ribosomal protein L23 [Candidatus Lokiarchaeota archaeon]MBS3793676.1 50S ribosomal protein L23 [Candidatus Thorarchaeota archaeon]